MEAETHPVLRFSCELDEELCSVIVFEIRVDRLLAILRPIFPEHELDIRDPEGLIDRVQETVLPHFGIVPRNYFGDPILPRTRGIIGWFSGRRPSRALKEQFDHPFVPIFTSKTLDQPETTYLRLPLGAIEHTSPFRPEDSEDKAVEAYLEAIFFSWDKHWAHVERFSLSQGREIASAGQRQIRCYPSVPFLRSAMVDVTRHRVPFEHPRTPGRPGLTSTVGSVTFGETPLRLRQLEQGWRERRRRVLEATGQAKPDGHVVGEGEIRGQVTANAGDEGKTSDISRMESLPVPMVARVMSRPPTPPLTPPPFAEAPFDSGHDPGHGVQRARFIHQPKPISRGCLPPTRRAIPLSRSSVSILVNPIGNQQDIIIRQANGDTICTRENGRSLSFVGTQGGSRELRLSDCQRWTEGDYRSWGSVWQVIEGYKRATPRMKFWHTLGRLTVSCSDPPDVVLMCEIPLRQRPSEKSITSGSSGQRITTVRIRYSPSTLVLELGTSSGTDMDELRTRRIVSLRVLGHTYDLQMISEDLRPACRAIGVVPHGWRNEELEAMRRLWQLRTEWARYV